MKVVDRKTVTNFMGDTRTVQHYNKLVGEKSHKLGLVASMYKNLSITTLTDSLLNIYANKQKSANSYQPINAMAIEWEIDVNFIPKFYIVETVTTATPGAGGVPFNIVVDTKYYDKNDTFTLENKQQVFVIAPPRRLGPARFEYSVILVTNDTTKSVDPRVLKAGNYTRYRSNYHPELSERGFTKYVSNTEMHRNHMNRHRASESVSGDYAIRETVYLQAQKEGKNEFFKMHKYEKDCMDTFMTAKNNAAIFSETNFDKNGKCLLQDESGKDIPMGDGIRAQIERFCDKFLYNALSSAVLDDVLFAMVEKSDQPKGNHYAVVCNERLYNQFGRIQKDDYRFNSPNDASYFYSKHKGGSVSVGADFDSYNIQGNSISFMPDRALSQEYDAYGFGMFLDTSSDLKSGRPNISAFTVEGAELVESTVTGMGGKDGRTSGEAVSGLHAIEYHILGYACYVVFNPYKSFILKENNAAY